MHINGEALESLLNTGELVAAIEKGFVRGAAAPLRSHYELSQVGLEKHLLLMPAWSAEIIGTKLVTVFPAQTPSIAAQYVLFDAQNGSLLALLDGTVLTPWRTAAVSALASSFLSRANSRRLLLLGTGAVARCMLRAHSWVRPIEEILVWGRNPDRLQKFVDEAQAEGIACHAVRDYLGIMETADIVCSATATTDPLVMGAHVSPGTHVDLVGSFRPHMRESDDQLIRIASKYADTKEGVLEEGGDYASPVARGVMSEVDVLGELIGLSEGRSMTRQSDEEVTLFKSVGTAVADLSSAAFALAAYQQ